MRRASRRSPMAEAEPGTGTREGAGTGEGSALSRIETVLPAAGLGTVLAARPAPPFAPETRAFVEDLGRRLRRDPAARAFPELVALGYWARRATVARLEDRFRAAYPGAVRLARGRAVHVAPANVDTIFVYSLLLSLIAGNVNVVRVSGRAGAQTGLLERVLGAALAEAPAAVRDRVAVIRHARDRAVTDALSALADIRIVWGGDASVAAIRESRLAPRATELVFPDRHSVAVMDAAAWLAAPEAERAGTARRLVNDTLWFGQMACSSPRALFWRGAEAAAEAASATLWPALDAAAVAAGIDLAPADAVAKLLAEQDLAVAGQGARVRETPSMRVRAVAGEAAAAGQRPGAGAGFFLEARIGALDALAPLVTPRWQTVVSEGIPAADWRAFLATHRPAGIDRVVAPGAALDFDALWDGVDLVAAMTRIATVAVPEGPERETPGLETPERETPGGQGAS